MKAKRKTLRQAKENKFVDRNLVPVNPLTEQFEPKGPEDIRAHKKMAGGK